jgi:hypothetical protein
MYNKIIFDEYNKIDYCNYNDKLIYDLVINLLNYSHASKLRKVYYLILHRFIKKCTRQPIHLNIPIWMISKLLKDYKNITYDEHIHCQNIFKDNLNVLKKQFLKSYKSYNYYNIYYKNTEYIYIVPILSIISIIGFFYFL